MTEHAPIQIVEKKKNRRRAAIIGSVGLGVAVLAGATLAAYIDSEWVSAEQVGTGLGVINLQIGSEKTFKWSELTDERHDFTSGDETSTPGVDDGGWKDTGLDGQPDGPLEWGTNVTVSAPLALEGTTDTQPLDPKGWQSASQTFYLRNSEASDLDIYVRLHAPDADPKAEDENKAMASKAIFNHVQYMLAVEPALLGGGSGTVFDRWSGTLAYVSDLPSSGSEATQTPFKKMHENLAKDGGLLKVTVTLMFHESFNDGTFENDWTTYLEKGQPDVNLLLEFAAVHHGQEPDHGMPEESEEAQDEVQ